MASSAAQSLGQDTTDISFQIRARDHGRRPRARFFTAGPRHHAPEPGRTMAPHWVTTEAEARKAVEEAAKKVDIVKIWVDDRDGTVQEAARRSSTARSSTRRTRTGLHDHAHIYTLEDAKGTLRAGVDAFAHGVRDKDVDDEFMALVKKHPNFVLGPNMPDRGVPTDLGWLRRGHVRRRLREARRGEQGRRRRRMRSRHPGAQPREAECGGRDDRARHRRQHALCAAHRDGRHGGRRHDADAGDRRGDAQRRASSCG